MSRGRELDNILEQCLERLLDKGETIEQCLSSYPEHAAELEPLLHTALAVKKTAQITPRPEFKARARYEFRSVLEETNPKRRWSLLGLRPQWATAIAIVLVLLVSGGSTVAASGNSMPDSPLYPVKLATEQVQATFTFSKIAKAELYAKLADRRVAELVYIVNQGKPEKIEPTARRLNGLLQTMADVPLAEKSESAAPPAPVQLAPVERAPAQLAPAERAPAQLARAERAPALQLTPSAEEKGGGRETPASRRARLRIRLGHYAVNHPDALRAALEKAPESAKPVLRRVIAISVTSYEKAIKSLE